LSLLDEFDNVIKVITTHENAVQTSGIDAMGKSTDKVMSEIFIPISPATFDEIRDAYGIEAVIDSKGNSVTLYDSYGLDFNILILVVLKFGY
jgi:hypothetical protein